MMMPYSDDIYDGLPTTFIVTQYMIKLIVNQIVSANLPLFEVSSGSEFCLTNYCFKCKYDELDLKLRITYIL